MKRIAVCILMLVSFVLMNYARVAHAEDNKPVIGAKDFKKTYVGKDISEIIAVLGEPNDIGQSGTIYYWDWDDKDKLPIKIKHDIYGDKYPYYANKIRVVVYSGMKKKPRKGVIESDGVNIRINDIIFDIDKRWRTDEEESRVAAEQQKKEEKDKAIADTLDKPLSALTVLSLINENTRTSTQISEFRKSAYGKYVEGVGIVTDVIRESPLPKKGKKYIPGDSVNVNTILISLGDKKDAEKGSFRVKMGTDMDTSSISLFQKIKFKGVFGRSKGGYTGEYIQLNNGEFELLK